MRTSAAIWPTSCLSAPETVICVGVGQARVIDLGASKITSWEKPKERTSQQDADSALSGIKSQLDGEKRMVSPEMLARIEKDNARKKLAQAKKKGIKLDNEQELLDIINGAPANKTTAPKTQPITKKDIIGGDGNMKSQQQPQQNLPTKPYYKDDVANVYDINVDDIEKIKKQWGVK